MGSGVEERSAEQSRRLESLGLLAGGIAHDFNNYLTGVLGNADLLMTRLDPGSPLRPLVHAIQDAGLKAAALTRQMLAYSGRTRLRVAPVDLPSLVREALPLLRASISRNAALEVEPESARALASADPAQIRQVLVNLVANASDALGEGGGTITVSTGVGVAGPSDLADVHPEGSLPPGTYAWLQVADTGPGMDARTLERVFDPFFSTKGAGRGMGLPVVLGIARSHGGGVRVEGRPGAGARVRVFLRPAEALQGDPEQATPAERRSGEGAQTVLLVDDEEMLRDLARTALEESAFRVLTASDGTEAVETVRQRAGEISLVLLDLTMPRMGGNEALREIRRIREDLPVVLCSGYSEADVDGLVGRDPAAFLHKPYRVADLLRTVRSILGP